MKYLLTALTLISCSCWGFCMPDYDVGDDLHSQGQQVGDYIDLDEGFDV